VTTLFDLTRAKIDMRARRRQSRANSIQLDLPDGNWLSNAVDLIAMENGGVCVGYSNAHYGHPR
jgi:allantoicase